MFDILSCSQFTDGVYFPPDTTAHCLDRAIYILIPQVAVVVLLYIVCVILTWGINDAFSIKTELKVLTIIIPLLFVPFAIRTITTLLTPYVDGSYFCLPIIGISFTVTIVYPVILSYRLEHAKARTRARAAGKLASGDSGSEENLTGNLNVLFRFVMDSEVMRREFQQFCVESWCVENYLFYRDAAEYEQLQTATERAVAGRRIGELYIGEGALRQINIDMRAERQARNGVMANEFDQRLFRPALEQVETQMKQDTLSHWKQTGHFRTLLAKVLKTEGMAPPRHATETSTAFESMVIQEV